jgi:hypothetical protein
MSLTFQLSRQGFIVTFDTLDPATFSGLKVVELDLSAHALLVCQEWHFVRWLPPLDGFLLEEHLPEIDALTPNYDNMKFVDNDMAEQYITLKLWFRPFDAEQSWGVGIYLKAPMSYFMFFREHGDIYHTFVSDSLNTQAMIDPSALLQTWQNSNQVNPFIYQGRSWCYHCLPWSQLLTWFDHVLPLNAYLINLLQQRYYLAQEDELESLMSNIKRL